MASIAGITMRAGKAMARRRRTSGDATIAAGSIIAAWTDRSKNRQPTAMHSAMTTAKNTQP